MVGTSIGGKAGINLPQGKNLISAFELPEAVIANVATLKKPISAGVCLRHGGSHQAEPGR
jgi:3-dehydroquinate synthetase